MVKTHGNTPACMDLPLVAPWTQEKYLKHSGDYNKFKFTKQKKVTMTESTMKQARKDDFPSAKYDLKSDFKDDVYPFKCDQNDKSLCIIDEAKYLAHQTPGAKYDGDYTKLKPKIYEYKIVAPTEVEEIQAGRNRPIEKNDSVAPGDHNDVLESYNYTQPHSNQQPFTSSPLFTFIDHFKKLKKDIPGAGTYFKAKDEVTLMQKLSPLPRELRVLRH